MLKCVPCKQRCNSIPGVEEDGGGRCFWLLQEWGVNTVLGLGGSQRSASQTGIIPAAQQDVRAHQGLPFHNILISAPRSISAPEWLVLCHLHVQESDGLIKLRHESCWQSQW